VDLSNDSRDPVFEDPIDGEDARPHFPCLCQVMGVADRAADANLQISIYIDQAFFYSSPKRGAVAVRLVGVFLVPGIGMRVEVDNGERSEFSGVGAQQRQADRVIASQGDDRNVFLQVFRRL